MRNKKRIRLLEDILWDLLRNLHFKWSPNPWCSSIVGYRKLLENNPHVKKRLKGTRTLTRYTRG